MSFLKSLFGKDQSKKNDCCDIKIVEVKDEASATTEAKTNEKN